MVTVERSHVISNNQRYLRVKYALDLTFAVILLIPLAPLLAIIALMIVLDSRGPAIYRQTRVGKDGMLFTILKFRTMLVDAPVLSTAEMQLQQRIPFTRIGPFLRKTSLDELPQLFNILRGEMSFVGPRPALPTQTDVLALRREMDAEWVRPGITGLAQVMGRDELDAETKVRYDADYCRTLSLNEDMRMLGLTVQAVLTSRGNK